MGEMSGEEVIRKLEELKGDQYRVEDFDTIEAAITLLSQQEEKDEFTAGYKDGQIAALKEAVDALVLLCVGEGLGEQAQQVVARVGGRSANGVN